MREALPRLIVEVRGGRSHGLKTVIDPGGSLSFGRTEIADIAISHDEMMSSVHFELAWDGSRCILNDRNSMKGTLLSGLPVLVAEVPHGGWVRAGRTDFMIYFEAHTPPRKRGKSPTLENPEEMDRLAIANGALAKLRAAADLGPLYAVLDAARDDRILEILRESVEPHQSLYEGADGDALGEVAPYLSGPMRADSTLLDRLVLEGWGRRWGIYASSRAPFKAVRRHFRRFLMAELEETYEKVYFRYYDPHVLEQFLPISTPAQRRHLGETLDALWHERKASTIGHHALSAAS